MVTLSLLLGLSGSTGAILLARLLVLQKRFTRRDPLQLSESLDMLPSVSVCIPARNETHAMTQCLERVIASTYPKLEIIVLDDESGDNTSILIKSFAHAGVRFVEGSRLPEDWLGKNYAQQELYAQASGEYILYLDVDTHIKPDSIDRLVAIALHEHAAMVSILPTREDAWRGSVLFATLRHFWSIMSHTISTPATTSNLWLVRKEFLRDNFDGFTRLKVAAAPERNVAAYASRQQAYRFFLGAPLFGVSYEKKWRSQCQTSIRTLYPAFGGNPIRAVVGLITLLVLLLPFLVVPTSLIIGWSPLHTVALSAATVLLVLYVAYTARMWRRGWLVGGILFPIILIQECILLIRSIVAYSTRSVTWKGRPIRQSAREAAE